MRFGDISLDEAEGAILAHSLKAGPIAFKKGRVLSGEDIVALKTAGVRSVTAARLEAGDVPEDAAAAGIADAILSREPEGVEARAAITGRCNLHACVRGVLVVDRVRLDALNFVDEAATVATLTPYELVEPGQMVATVKIIPFALGSDSLMRCRDIALGGGGPNPWLGSPPCARYGSGWSRRCFPA